MSIVFEQIPALFRGSPNQHTLEPGATYTLQITYSRSDGTVKIAVRERELLLLRYNSWSALLDDWTVVDM